MAIRIPVLTKCCCCLPLRIGCLIVGYMNIITSGLTLAGVSWYIFYIHQSVEASKLNPNPANPPAQMEKEAVGLYINFGFYLLAFLYNCILNLVLVIGVHTNKPRLLRSYCYATLALFTLGVALIAISWVFMGFLAAVGIFKWCFALLFVAIIVRSTYLEMEEQLKPPMQEMGNLYTTQQAPLMA